MRPALANGRACSSEQNAIPSAAANARRHSLRARGTDSEKVIQRRLREAKYEMSQRDFFDHIIVNDTLENAQRALDEIMYPESAPTAAARILEKKGGS